jgi:hypothetical protein
MAALAVRASAGHEEDDQDCASPALSSTRSIAERTFARYRVTKAKPFSFSS